MRNVAESFTKTRIPCFAIACPPGYVFIKGHSSTASPSEAMLTAPNPLLLIMPGGSTGGVVPEEGLDTATNDPPLCTYITGAGGGRAPRQR